MRRPVLPAVAIAALLTLAACGDGSDTATPEDAATTQATDAPTSAAGSTADPGTTVTGPGSTSPGATTVAPTAPAVTVPEILDVTGETVSDGPLSLAAFAGKPVALWFWAPG